MHSYTNTNTPTNNNTNYTQPATTQTHPTCNPNQPEINANNRVPLGEPLVGHPRITSAFGDRIHPVTGVRTPHRGIDFAAAIGTMVFSPAAGTVSQVWTDDSCGRGIVITHSDGYQTVYCHLNEQLVRAGDAVHAGCAIARSGNTGRSTGPHLHYGIKMNGTYIDPTKLLQR